MAELPPDWNEFIGLLRLHRVRFVVVGAHAVAAAGRPRATQDLDVLVEPTAANAERLGRALRAFGFATLAADAARFAERDRMATLGRPPLQIDILTSISGVGFAEAWAGRKRVRLGPRRPPDDPRTARTSHSWRRWPAGGAADASWGRLARWNRRAARWDPGPRWSHCTGSR
jgi:hypothetical protein